MLVPDLHSSSRSNRELILKEPRPVPKAHVLRSSAPVHDLVLFFARVGRQDLRIHKRLPSKVKFPLQLDLNFRWVSSACVELTLHRFDVPRAESLRMLGFAILSNLGPSLPPDPRATDVQRQAFRAEHITRLRIIGTASERRVGRASRLSFNSGSITSESDGYEDEDVTAVNKEKRPHPNTLVSFRLPSATAAIAAKKTCGLPLTSSGTSGLPPPSSSTLPPPPGPLSISKDSSPRPPSYRTNTDLSARTATPTGSGMSGTTAGSKLTFSIPSPSAGAGAGAGAGSGAGPVRTPPASSNRSSSSANSANGGAVPMLITSARGATARSMSGSSSSSSSPSAAARLPPPMPAPPSAGANGKDGKGWVCNAPLHSAGHFRS
ncbi:unnamed protein product [Tilletia laevis]|uniref:C2 NT-type domain-containing protein n=2 Tax=Tilletia TaxID=13289 RepID=A0A177TX68_9BASI|nr:hypothetical protein CF336_g8129 [Tilletia laevis]KAE8246279.1 hypothetical protein A4X03_0g7286 [Tilletia caries]CAD6898995.1 unnamed protein product [Tilletia controversa]KAE8190625.1 hypothetical protein CF335_g6310 [Tilletia laevis]CAD6920463.1 unnamed protein product [Tilletia caries]